MTLRSTCVLFCLSAMACAPDGDTVTSDWLDEGEATRAEQDLAFEDAIFEVELGADELGGDPWAEIDADAELNAAIATAEARNCRVTGAVGGFWSDEHNRLRAKVRRFRGGGADLIAGWQRVRPEGGVWAGHWRSFSGEVEGTAGGLYDLDERHLAGVWSVDDRPEGVVHAKWRRINERGGVLLGVWANCEKPDTM